MNKSTATGYTYTYTYTYTEGLGTESLISYILNFMDEHTH